MFKETILSKKLIASLAALLLVTTVIAADLQIFVGKWADGAKIEWACPKGTNGTVKFRFTQIDGSQYIGELDCGEGV
jgi:hypothetical protein